MTKDWYERTLIDKQCEIERLRGEIIALGRKELYLKELIACADSALRPSEKSMIQELREAAK